jgi:hypothetical protein
MTVPEEPPDPFSPSTTWSPSYTRSADGRRARLHELEGVVECGIRAFVEAGTALREIRDSRLYQLTHPNFEEYLRQRWGLGKSHGYRLIQAAKVAEEVRELSPNGDMPKTEAQARALSAPGLSYTVQMKVVERIARGGGWGNHTAEDVRLIVSEEEAAHRERVEAQDYLAGGTLPVAGTAAVLRRTPLRRFYERRKVWYPPNEALAWLLNLRDDAAFIAREADALVALEADVEVPDAPPDHL